MSLKSWFRTERNIEMMEILNGCPASDSVRESRALYRMLRRLGTVLIVMLLGTPLAWRYINATHPQAQCSAGEVVLYTPGYGDSWSEACVPLRELITETVVTDVAP